MKFSYLLLPVLVSAAALPEAQITPAPLVKRSQKVLSDDIWTSTSEKILIKVTPTVIDGVTISASPVGSPTVWASLDGSGIPYLITPTVDGSTTISASPTPTDTSYPTASYVPPVLRCFGDRVPSSDTQGYPFCSALNGTEMVVGETYWLTWDPTYWGGNDVTQVKIELIKYPQTGTDDTLMTTKYLSNADGYFPLTIISDYIRDGNGYMWVTITPLVTSGTDATNVGVKTGPLIRAIASKGAALTTVTKVPSDNGLGSSSSGSSKAKVIAPAVIIPIIAVTGIAGFVIWYLKKQKKHASIVTSRARIASTSGEGEINLSKTTTTTSVVTSETGANPFSESSRTVL
jgi:hypothetical protein